MDGLNIYESGVITPDPEIEKIVFTINNQTVLTIDKKLICWECGRESKTEDLDEVWSVCLYTYQLSYVLCPTCNAKRIKGN